MRYTLMNTMFALIIHGFLTTDGQQCSLSKLDLQTLNHVFFVDDKLMRQAAVPDRSVLKLVCGAGNKADIVGEYRCDGTVLSPTLPTDNCNNRFKPEIVIGQSDDCVAPAKLYQVGFKLDGAFTELYSSCYNAATMQAKYVKHTVYQKSFATNRPDATFTTDYIITGADAETYGPQSVYNRFVDLLGVNQGYVEGPMDIVVNRGHLAPSGDFLFIENKRATFKYINLMPQFGRINNGNWKRLEYWVENLGCNEANVMTGTIGVLELPHADDPSKLVPMYLGNNQKNPIPKWMYKVVNSVIFVTYNNPFATDLPVGMPCPPVNCPCIGLQADFRLGYTYCCSVTSLNNILNF